MSRAIVSGALANAAAFLCVVVAFLKRDDVTADGAYFNDAVGVSADKLALTYGSSPWLLAAGVLLLIGTTILIRASVTRSQEVLPPRTGSDTRRLHG